MHKAKWLKPNRNGQRRALATCPITEQASFVIIRNCCNMMVLMSAATVTIVSFLTMGLRVRKEIMQLTNDVSANVEECAHTEG